MHLRRKFLPLLVTAIVLAAPAGHAVQRGQTLSAALEELRARGLRLVFSSALVRPDLTVDVDVDASRLTPEEIARRILAPHGLTLEAVQSGLFSVVPLENPGSPAAAAAPSAPSAPPQRSNAPDNEPLYQVDVYASKYVIDEATFALAELSRQDVERLPGLNQDVMRVTRFLPGTASNPVSARSHVRGGREDELAVFFDGVPLFEPFHYKDVQSLLGLLDPGSISKIDFFSGVLPAQYGNRMSGVLDIAPRAWTGENHHELGFSVLYTHALTQGRLESEPVEWLAGVRLGNIGAFTELIDHDETEPDFTDALVRLKWDTGPRSSLTGGVLVLDDSLDTNLGGGIERGDFEYRDSTGWAAWHFSPHEGSQLRVLASRTERHTSRIGALNRPGSAVGDLNDRREFDTTTLRIEGSTRAGSRAIVNAGIESYDYEAAYDYRSQTQLNPFLAAAIGTPSSRTNVASVREDGGAYAAFGSVLFDISKRVALDVALRWDAQRFGPAFSSDQVSPRLSLQYRYDPRTVMRLSWGRMSQTERPDELQVPDGDPFFHATQRSTQSVLSVEHLIRDSALLRVEAYDKRVTNPTPIYENLFDPFALLPELEADRVRVSPVRSRMHGAELSLRWQLPRGWSGWTSYSFSEATDEFDSEPPALRTWDQKHAIATGLAWVHKSWQFSGNVNWHSGWRRNALVETENGVELAPRNAVAWPSYFSLDVRTTWSRPMRRGVLEVFGEIDNVTNHGNLCCASYSVSSAGGIGALSPDTSTWLPRLYLMGVTWKLP